MKQQKRASRRDRMKVKMKILEEIQAEEGESDEELED